MNLLEFWFKKSTVKDVMGTTGEFQCEWGIKRYKGFVSYVKYDNIMVEA